LKNPPRAGRVSLRRAAYCDFFGSSELLPALELGLGLDGALELELESSFFGPDIEPGLAGAVLEPDEEDEAEPGGEDGRLLLEDDDPLEDLSRCAFGPLVCRSQPYRPLTATAIGRRTKADFFNKLIWKLLS